jgi:cation diffusion facilitator family transporter
VTPTRPTATEYEVPSHEKRKVALSSLAAAAILAGLKIAVGILTGSLGILSEAAHSGLDFVAAAVTYFSVRVSDKPADSSHPFGHGKVEHLSAFIETALLLLTCAWIILEAVKRLFFREVHVEPTLAAFGVMFISITVDTFRSRALFRVARKYNSQALEADALHFSTDVYSSSVVILGLVLVYIADHQNIPWLRDADPVAALVVAGIVVYISLRLGKKTVDALVDAAPEGASAQIAQTVSAVPGVLSHERIRVRQSGGQLFIDLGVTLASNIPFEHARSLVEEVEQRVQRLFPAADVVVHAAPQPPAPSDLLEKVRAIAHRANYEIHDLTAYVVKGRVNVSLDLELDPALRLDEAHDVASVLEEEIKREIAEVEEINIHIEPRQSRVESGDEAEMARAALEKKLLDIARETPGLLDCHALEAHEVGGNVLVSVHATLEGDLALTQVHDITEDLEFRFRQAFPQIFKVSIHAEPKGKS